MLVKPRGGWAGSPSPQTQLTTEFTAFPQDKQTQDAVISSPAFPTRLPVPTLSHLNVKVVSFFSRLLHGQISEEPRPAPYILQAPPAEIEEEKNSLARQSG